MRPFITLGDLIADLYLGIESFPVAPGQHQSVSALGVGPGGAGNAAVAAARLGLAVQALGAVGEDWVGAQVLAHLQAEGVDVDAVARLAGEPTAVAVVLRAERGEHVFLSYAGTRGLGELPAAWQPLLGAAGAVLVDGWTWRHDHPAVIAAGAQWAAAAGVPVLFDPGPLADEADPAWLRALLAAATVVLATEAEADRLVERLGLGTPASLAPAPRTLILKRGADGCQVSGPAGAWACPGYPVTALDLTAAGDCFAAAVAWGLLHAWPWDVIGAVANAAGAAKVQKLGTALAAPTRAEVGAVLQRFRPDLAGLVLDAPARSRRAPRCEG